MSMQYPKILEHDPTRIRAMQWTGDNFAALRSFAPVLQLNGTVYLWVEANQSQLPIVVNEWVAQDEIGFYPIHDEVIAKGYHEVDSL